MQNISCRYEDPIIKSMRAMKMLAPYEGLDVYLFYLEGIRNGSVYYEIYNCEGDKIFEAVRPLSRFRKSIRDMILSGKKDFLVTKRLWGKRKDWEVFEGEVVR